MPGLNPTEQDIEQFRAITQATHEEAVEFLSTGTTLPGAIEDYYNSQTGSSPDSPSDQQAIEASLLESEPAAMSDTPPQQPGRSGGPMTLGGQPADDKLPPGWGQPQRRTGRVGEWTSGGQERRPGEMATLWNTGIAGAGGGRGGPPMPGGRDDDDDDHDEEDDDERRRGEELYAGGERSGLAIQNPGDEGPSGARGIVSNILKQAAQNGPRDTPPAAGRSNPFGGSGHALGSEDTPSTSAAPSDAASASQPRVAAVSPNAMDQLLAGMFGRSAPAPPQEEEEPQIRRLTFWRDGFSIEDGPLFKYSDPGNRELLEAIQSGRAPPSLFNVRFDQPVQIEVAQRTGEDYKEPPKRPMKAFEGGGNRLGSPAPEVTGSGASTPTMPGGILVGGSGSSSAAASSAPPSSGTKFEVDESKPTTSVQVRLGDGTRMVARVNLTHTVGDLRNFVSAARADNRPFLLQTTFPSRELSDPSETIEGAKLQNAVVVQRFT